mgnify:FL=1
MEIKFKQLHPNAKLPLRGSDGAAGYDLYAADYTWCGGLNLFYTGLAVEIPEGYFGAIYPRSSGCFQPYRMYGTMVIDSDFRGEIIIPFYDPDVVFDHPAFEAKRIKWLDSKGKKPSLAGRYSLGDRIAQLVVQPCVNFEPVWAETLSETARGTGGYGSTGR